MIAARKSAEEEKWGRNLRGGSERTEEREKGRKVSTEEEGPNYAAIFYLLERAEREIQDATGSIQKKYFRREICPLHFMNIERLSGNVSLVYQCLCITLYLTVNSSFSGQGSSEGRQQQQQQQLRLETNHGATVNG